MKYVLRYTVTPLLFVVAVFFVLLEHIAGWLKALVIRIPLPAVWMQMEEAMIGLPAYGALACLMIPLLGYLGLSVVEVGLLAGGQIFLALVASGAAKVVGVGIGLRLWGKLEANVRRIDWVTRLVDWGVVLNNTVHHWLSRFLVWRMAVAWVEWVKAQAIKVAHIGNGQATSPLVRRFGAIRRSLRAIKWRKRGK